MTVTRYTSRVFAAGRALYDQLAAAPWTEHPTTGLKPPVEFSDENPLSDGESVCVALNFAERGDNVIEWRRMSPPGRDEELHLFVVIRSLVPSVDTSLAVWDRLEELAAIAQGVTFDTSTNRVVELGFDGELAAGLVVSVVPSVFPTGSGWAGFAVIEYRLLASI